MIKQKIIMPYELSVLICHPGCNIISDSSDNKAGLIAIWDQEAEAPATSHKTHRLLSRVQVAFKNDHSFETSHLMLDAVSRTQLGYRSVIHGIYIVSEDQLTFFYTRAFIHREDSENIYSSREELIEESNFVHASPLTLSIEHGRITWLNTPASSGDNGFIKSTPAARHRETTGRSAVKPSRDMPHKIKKSHRINFRKPKD